MIPIICPGCFIYSQFVESSLINEKVKFHCSTPTQYSLCNWQPLKQTRQLEVLKMHTKDALQKEQLFHPHSERLYMSYFCFTQKLGVTNQTQILSWFCWELLQRYFDLKILMFPMWTNLHLTFRCRISLQAQWQCLDEYRWLEDSVFSIHKPETLFPNN